MRGYHHNKDTITIHLQIQTYRCMLHTVLINTGLEHSLRWFAPMLQATRENLRVKDVCGLKPESQPTAKYI
jgi:hypothetical protein